MKTSVVKQILDYISSVNPTVNEVSSLGSYTTPMGEAIAEKTLQEITECLSEGTLAHKIATSTEIGKFSEKQLWVIAYALEKNEDYKNMVVSFYAEIERKRNAKAEASKQKLAANKAGSQSVLDYIKENGRLLKDYYAFVKTSKMYKKEFFSKKFTMESAEAFLNA